MVKLNTINSHFKGVKKSTMMNNFFFLFLPRYPHTFLKDEASPVRGSGLPLPISALLGNRTCVLTLVGI